MRYLSTPLGCPSWARSLRSIFEDGLRRGKKRLHKYMGFWNMSNLYGDLKKEEVICYGRDMKKEKTVKYSFFHVLLYTVLL